MRCMKGSVPTSLRLRFVLPKAQWEEFLGKYPELYDMALRTYQQATSHNAWSRPFERLQDYTPNPKGTLKLTR